MYSRQGGFDSAADTQTTDPPEAAPCRRDCLVINIDAQQIVFEL